MPDEAPAESAVEIPHVGLPPHTLRSIVEDLVTRDGTDYGATERTLDQKVAALMRQLESGDAKLVFDPSTETIGLLTTAALAQATRGGT